MGLTSSKKGKVAKKSNARKSAATGGKKQANSKKQARQEATGSGEPDVTMANTMVKSRNKLVGDLQNNDLYGSDEDKDF